MPQLAGSRAEASEIAQLRGRWGGRCGQSVRTYEDRLARALASIINVFDPDVIVLGGGLSNIARLYAICRHC